MGPGRNKGIRVLERPSPFPPIEMVPASAVSSSIEDASSVGTQKNSHTPVLTPMNQPPT